MIDFKFTNYTIDGASDIALVLSFAGDYQTEYILVVNNPHYKKFQTIEYDIEQKEMGIELFKRSEIESKIMEMISFQFDKEAGEIIELSCEIGKVDYNISGNKNYVGNPLNMTIWCDNSKNDYSTELIIFNLKCFSECFQTMIKNLEDKKKVKIYL